MLAQLHGMPTLRALQAVLRREGVRGLYGGVTSAALGAGCARASSAHTPSFVSHTYMHA